MTTITHDAAEDICTAATCVSARAPAQAKETTRTELPPKVLRDLAAFLSSGASCPPASAVVGVFGAVLCCFAPFAGDDVVVEEEEEEEQAEEEEEDDDDGDDNGGDDAREQQGVECDEEHALEPATQKKSVRFEDEEEVRDHQGVECEESTAPPTNAGIVAGWNGGGVHAGGEFTLKSAMKAPKTGMRWDHETGREDDYDEGSDVASADEAQAAAARTARGHLERALADQNRALTKYLTDLKKDLPKTNEEAKSVAQQALDAEMALAAAVAPSEELERELHRDETEDHGDDVAFEGADEEAADDEAPTARACSEPGLAGLKTTHQHLMLAIMVLHPPLARAHSKLARAEKRKRRADDALEDALKAQRRKDGDTVVCDVREADGRVVRKCIPRNCGADEICANCSDADAEVAYRLKCGAFVCASCVASEFCDESFTCGKCCAAFPAETADKFRQGLEKVNDDASTTTLAQ